MMYAFSLEKIEIKSDSRNANRAVTCDEFNGAAIIDQQGNEVPITEAMVQHALEVMAESWAPWHAGQVIKPQKNKPKMIKSGNH